MLGKNKTINERIENIKAGQKMLVNCQDEYNVGMYNGIEYALAILEGRDPRYFVAVGEKEVREDEKVEQKQRTIITGMKRRIM